MRELYEQNIAAEIYVGLNPTAALQAFRGRLPVSVQDMLIDERRRRIDAEIALEVEQQKKIQ